MSEIKKRKGLLLVIGLLLSVSLLCSGCGQAKKEGEGSRASDLDADILEEKGNQASDNDVDQTDAYQTDTVKRGTFTKSSSFDGVVYYPELSQVTYEGEEAVLSEWLVEQGSEVKAGDPLAYIQIEYDEVALQEMELVLERLESDYEWQREQMEEALAKKRKEAGGASGKSREALEYQKAEKELALYDLSMGEQIEAQRKAVSEWKERIEVTAITAPRDGVVSDLAYLKSGEVLPQGESLMVLYNPDVVWLQVTDTNAALRYNMEVDIETGTPKNRVAFSGRVIAADNILPDALRRGIAFIELTDLPEKVNWSNTSIRANLISIEEVLLINRLAVESDTGESFVYVLEDGTLHKRQVIRAGQGTEAAWILTGLEEGQKVVISGAK